MGERTTIETIRTAARTAPLWRIVIVGAAVLFVLVGLVGITVDGVTAFIHGITGHRDITFGWVISSLGAIYPAAIVYLFRAEWASVIRFLLVAGTSEST